MNLKYIILLCFIGLIANVAAASVSATLDSEVIPLNQAARLTVNIKGGEGISEPQLPGVDDLSFAPIGQSRQVSIVNGHMTSTLSFSYQITASKEGEHRIPPVTVQVGGQRFSSLPLSLKVTAPQKNIASARPGQKRPLSEEEQKQIKETAFLTISRADNKGREHLYVGESTPVMIRAYLRRGLRVRGIGKPSISSEAFTLSALSDEPEQDTVMVKGVPYHVITWYGNLSGVKAGEYQLTADLKATLSIPSKRSSNRRRGSGPFDDPFFDSFFASYKSKEVTLTSKAKKTQVLSPPLKGRPASFSGAVGQYQIKASKLPAAIETGEAITLEVAIEGKGNFDRVNKPTLMPAKIWKTYQEKDRLERGDIINFHARKHFSIPAVATKPGEVETFFQFSYFDPETEEYRTVETEKQKTKITGESVSMTDPVASGGDARGNTDVSNLPVIKSNIGFLPSSNMLLHQRVWFWGLMSLLAIIVLVCAVISVIRSHQSKYPEVYHRRKLHKDIKRQLSNVRSILEKGEVLPFFQQCRLVLQTQIAGQNGGQAEAVTINEVLASYPTCHTAIEVFRKADEVEFATPERPQESMHEWIDKIHAALKEIENPPLSTTGQVQSSWGQVTSIS